MNSRLPAHDLVLLGAGHTNAHVLRMWRMRPLLDVRLTCVSDFSVATYSGMLPGTLAGLYGPGEMQIDLVRLCAAAGARFIEARVTGLDVSQRQLLLDDRPALPFDLLSIGIGSIPSRATLQREDETLLPIKPMQTFLARLDARLAVLCSQVHDRALRIAVVGAGAGGVEIAFCLPAHLAALGWSRFELTLLDRSATLVPGLADGARQRVRREFERRGVRFLLDCEAIAVQAGNVEFAGGDSEPYDLVIWSTGAAAPPLLAQLGLPVDDQGFLQTRATLQSIGCHEIFAVGDSGSIVGAETPKAGVYAVRQGPILWRNLGHKLRQEPLVEYRPQQGFLSLLATGDRRAIASYKGRSAHAGWCWRLKNRIDRRFMAMYQDYRPMPATVLQNEESTAQMRCTGCGGKVGGSVLSAALARLEIPRSEQVLLGLEAPDDVAIVQSPGGRPVAITADFFASFLDDPYLVGRVAALNAASDLFASGATPLAALALATLPLGPQRQQEQLLYELLSGALHEFSAMGATLAGGHTIEGPQTTIGFTLLADVGAAPPLKKSGLRMGDALILTKPLGTGVLLAAHMQARCRAEWFAPLLESLVSSNQQSAELLRSSGATAMTDVTGFGLAGHLLEMLRASQVSAQLHLSALTLLPGVAELLAEGLESTLAPANRTAEAEIQVAPSLSDTPGYRALFDPQTAGGILAGVAAPRAEQVIVTLTKIGVTAAIVGEITSHQQGMLRLHIQ